jgi:hypothetical protein
MSYFMYSIIINIHVKTYKTFLELFKTKIRSSFNKQMFGNSTQEKTIK